MSASFLIYKYIGKDGIFGNPVSSIGLKRVDQVVPAVYGNPVMPGDDASDANTYCVFRPDEPGCEGYSFESIFKLKLATPPSNQLSNVRIWPSAIMPCDPEAGSIFIGHSVCFSRPTNTKSNHALFPLYDYNRENPFYVTVNGNAGQGVNCKVTSQQYQLTVKDVGFGNIFFVDGSRQMPLLMVEGNTYTLVNNQESLLPLTIFDMSGNIISSHPNITYNSGVVVINATAELFDSFPAGLIYATANNIHVGSTISWTSVTWGTTEIVNLTVDVRPDPMGKLVYYVNDVRQPILTFQQNVIYQIRNLSGATFPLRLVSNPHANIACAECDIATQGVTVYDGATSNELIVLNTDQMFMSGPPNWAWAYQAVTGECMGNLSYVRNTCLVGNYNINTVGAGIANPMRAGETDFIYLQLHVNGKTRPEFVLPDIIIEWDES